MTTPEQAAVLNAVKAKKNVFITGAGGVGKSHVIREIVTWGAETGVNVAVTAMTGCAAVLLSGKTLHSWAGIGLARESPAELLKIVQSRGASRWNKAQILVIDEVSMMTPDILEKLDYIARRIRKKPNTKFGGLQLVLVGDFCQLPPVSSNQFLFESPIWSTLIDETHNLVQIVRQKDPVFQRILTEARMGALTSTRWAQCSTSCSPGARRLCRSTRSNS
jgi:ATP-dependent DNA helicase PIF1